MARHQPTRSYLSLGQALFFEFELFFGQSQRFILFGKLVPGAGEGRGGLSQLLFFRE